MQPFPFRQLCSKSPAQLYQARSMYDGWTGNCLDPGPWISDGRLAVLPQFPQSRLVRMLATPRGEFLLPQSVIQRVAQQFLSPLPPISSPAVEVLSERRHGKFIAPPLIVLTDTVAMNGYYHDLVIAFASPDRFLFCPDVSPVEPGTGFYFRQGLLVAVLRGYRVFSPR